MSTKKTGWVLLELEGEPGEIERSLAWAQQKGVRIDPVAGDIVEG
ncbi:MAG: NIL domain-containing protein [Dehalococcoidia bacterium]|nr:NIL domain-containing protein [Dehalococcoidia bacterium]